MALGLTGGFPVAAKVGAGSVLSGANLSSFLAGSNPIMAGLSAVSSIFGGGTKIDKTGAAAGGESRSGEAAFFGKNNIGKSAAFDLGNPVHAAILAAGVVGAIYVYKKYVR